MLRPSLVAVVTCLAAAPAGAWLTATNGGDPAASDRADAVAVDGAGDVVAAGSTEAGFDDVFTVVKYRGADGTIVWTRRVTGSGDGTGRAVAVGVDPANAVVAAGYLNGPGTSDDFIVVKWDADGTELWRRVIDGELGGLDAATALAVDPAGNVAAAGYVGQSDSFFDLFVILWNVAGEEQFRGYVEGVVPGGFDAADDVTFDPDGNVVVAGTIDGGNDVVVSKWDPTGGEPWRRTLRGTNTMFLFQSVAGVRTDADGNVVVAGALSNLSTGFDFTVVSWDPDGVERWRRSVNGAVAGSSDAATALAIDGDDAVVAVGYTQNEASTDWTAVKWTPDGAEVWRRIFVGDPQLTDAVPAAVTTDGDGAVIAAGSLYDAIAGYYDLVVLKSASDGPEIWRSILDGPADDESVQSEASEGWASVAVDGDGHVLVAGVMIFDGTDDDFTVAKLDGATGALTICGNGVVEPGEDCDPGSDVPGDCCTAACAARADGDACEDGDSDACAEPDTCGAAACRSGARSCRLDVPDEPIPVALNKPIVPLDCEASPGWVCRAALFEGSSAILTRGGAAATGPRPLSRKVRLRVRSDGRAVLKLKLNGRGQKLLAASGNANVPVLVRATIRDPAGVKRNLEKALLLRRR
jgi:uncharacterized delta-60 repeat protein